jgi:hypothetical protein
MDVCLHDFLQYGGKVAVKYVCEQSACGLLRE